MHSLAPELEQLGADPLLIAKERREIVNVYPELRFATWAGVMLIATGVGIIVRKNFDRIGPLAIAIAIALAAAFCYGFVLWREKSHAETRRGLLEDYLLLLGSLLVSADAAFIEHHFKLLGDDWHRHFLFLTVFHAVIAYRFRSRLVLPLSLAALAAWFGLEQNVETIFDSSVDTALRGFACAAVIFAWRFVSRGVVEFRPVFEHFATNLAFWSALALAADEYTRLLGCAIAVTFAVVSAMYGLKTKQEMFVIYGWIYGLIAVNIVFAEVVGATLGALMGVLSTIAAIIGLFVIHARMREDS